MHRWLLVSGALILGLVYGYLAQQTKTIRWTAASHVLAGLARVIALYPIGS